MNSEFYSLAKKNNDLGTTLGASILRDSLLPDLIGNDTTILYWAGKRIARKFPLAKDEDLPFFFKEANWGNLERIKEKFGRQTFELSGSIVKMRKQLTNHPEFLLEAGFIAETIQNQSGFTSEASVDLDSSKSDSVFITVQVDQHDPIDLNTLTDVHLLNPSGNK